MRSVIRAASSLPFWAIAPLWVSIGAAQAQTAPSPSDPADANAPVPAVRYRSPFSGYQAFGETPVAPWRATNDLVLQRGGWRAYAREASAPAVAAPSATGAASSPMRAHRGHDGHPAK